MFLVYTLQGMWSSGFCLAADDTSLASATVGSSVTPPAARLQPLERLRKFSWYLDLYTRSTHMVIWQKALVASFSTRILHRSSCLLLLLRHLADGPCLDFSQDGCDVLDRLATCGVSNPVSEEHLPGGVVIWEPIFQSPIVSCFLRCVFLFFPEMEPHRSFCQKDAWWFYFLFLLLDGRC